MNRTDVLACVLSNAGTPQEGPDEGALAFLLLRTSLGTPRIVDMLVRELLPRIC